LLENVKNVADVDGGKKMNSDNPSENQIFSYLFTVAHASNPVKTIEPL
jgi:hypothetical protein